MVLDVLFGPLFSLDPALGVLIFSLIILVVINVFYKFLINQPAAKAIKERQKEISKKMQDERKAGNTEAMNRLMKEALSENGKLMRMTLKPMLVSFVIVIIFLPWLHTSYGDTTIPLVNGTGIVSLQGVNHTVLLNGDDIAITDSFDYRMFSSIHPCDDRCFVIDNRSYEVHWTQTTATFAPIVTTLPVPLPGFGQTLGWLGWYLIVSIPLALVIRRLMKIYV